MVLGCRAGTSRGDGDLSRGDTLTLTFDKLTDGPSHAAVATPGWSGGSTRIARCEDVAASSVTGRG